MEFALWSVDSTIHADSKCETRPELLRLHGKTWERIRWEKRILHIMKRNAKPQYFKLISEQVETN